MKKCPYCDKNLKPSMKLPKLGDIVVAQNYLYGAEHWHAEIVYIASNPNTDKVRGKHRVMLRYLESGDHFIGTLEHCRKVENK